MEAESGAAKEEAGVGEGEREQGEEEDSCCHGGLQAQNCAESFRLGHFILNHLCCTLLHRGKVDSANQVETFESLCAFGGVALQMAFYLVALAS